MSQAHPEDVNVAEAGILPGIGDHQYPPQSAQNQASKGVSNFVDGSGPIFSMYLEMATEEDKKMVEAWQADADGILIFTGLFSAAVASLISVSIQDIRPNPQDTSNFYLANIYQTVSNPNQSSTLPTSPPPFSPPTYAVWVNSLWFMSLVISLTCALLATLLQQWARRYLKITQPRYSLDKRARIRAFFAEGVDKFLLPWAVEALPTLLHVSLFLFLAGLAVFLWNVNLTIFKLVLSWVSACMALYGCITLMPIIRRDSPYHTPLSLPAWHIITGIPYITYGILRWFSWSVYRYGAWNYFSGLEESYRKFLTQGMQKTAEDTARKSPSEIDTRAFLWTFDSLDEDHELERFFSGLPGFRGSKLVDDPLPSLTGEQTLELSMALIGLLDRTFASDLLPHHVKRRRAVVCGKAIKPTDTSESLFWRILNRILSEDQYGPVQSAEIAHLVRGWGEGKDVQTTAIIQAIVFGIIAKARRRDDSWFILASNELGVPESVLRDCAVQGDSLSLAVLTHITRLQFNHYRELGEVSSLTRAYSRVLGAASRFDVQNTLPEQQHEFCALWNQIVLKARGDEGREIALFILRPIRQVYVTLHRHTDAAPTAFSASTSDNDDILFQPTSYPLCNIPGHHSDPTLHIHGDSASATFAHTSPNDDAALSPASIASPDAPFSSVPTSLHVLDRLTEVPLPDSFDPVHQATIESVYIPVTSPVPAAAGAIQVIVTSVISTPDPAPEPSTPAPSLSFTSPPAAVSLQHDADLRTPFDAPNLSTLAPVLDDMTPTESHHSIIVTTAPNARPGPTSAPDLGASAEDDGNPRPGFRKEQDALDLPSVNRAIHAYTTATLDLRPQFPSVTDPDVAILGPSLRGPNAERSEDSPDLSRFPYDIV